MTSNVRTPVCGASNSAAVSALATVTSATVAATSATAFAALRDLFGAGVDFAAIAAAFTLGFVLSFALMGHTPLKVGKREHPAGCRVRGSTQKGEYVLSGGSRSVAIGSEFLPQRRR